MKNKLEERAKKINEVYRYDINYYLVRLFDYPENEWFYPYDDELNEDYSICLSLFNIDLICKKEVPFYVNGSYKGKKVYFMYNKDLNY